MSFAPPAVKTKNDSAAPTAAVTPPGVKAPKAEKTPKVAKEPADPNAPKKERAPKADYGYAKNSIIRLTDKEPKFKGQRLEWYDRVKPFNGKTCDEFNKAHGDVPNGKGVFYAPSGWLRFYAREGYLTLERGAPEPAKAPKVEAPKA